MGEVERTGEWRRGGFGCRRAWARNVGYWRADSDNCGYLWLFRSGLSRFCCGPAWWSCMVVLHHVFLGAMARSMISRLGRTCSSSSGEKARTPRMESFWRDAMVGGGERWRAWGGENWARKEKVSKGCTRGCGGCVHDAALIPECGACTWTYVGQHLFTPTGHLAPSTFCGDVPSWRCSECAQRVCVRWHVAHHRPCRGE